VNAWDILQQQACNRRSDECHASAKRGHGLTHCPNHDDPGPSLMVKQDGEHVHLHCFAGCDRRDVREKLGITPRPYFTVPVQARSYARRGGDQGAVEAQYVDYIERETSAPLRKNRHEGKTFSWESQNAAGRWERGRKGLKPGIYHQVDVVNANPGAIVFYAGGEKGADAICARGELATCNPDGDGSWDPDFAEYVRDKTVIMVPDNDEPGRRFARRFAQDVAGAARHVYVVELPGLGDREDVFDFLARGGTVETIVRLALGAGEARPPEPFPDPPQHAADIARDLQAAHDRLSLTLSVDRNKSLGAVRHTAVQVVNHVAAAIDRGEVDDDGAAKVYLTTMATSAGISRGQLGRHVDRLAEWGLIEKRISRTVEDGEWKSATYITLTDSPEATLQRLAVFTPETTAPLRTVPRCPDCGETAGVRKVWSLVCDGCGQVLESGDELMFRKATSDDAAEGCSPPSPSDRSSMVPFATSAPAARGPVLLVVPKATSDDGPLMGDCADCGQFRYRPLGAPRHGWACEECLVPAEALS
jgi:hypothetical protein